MLLWWTMVFLLLHRFGLVSVWALYVFLSLALNTGTGGMSSWYQGTAVAFYLANLAFVGYGFFTVMRGKSQYPGFPGDPIPREAREKR